MTFISRDRERQSLESINNAATDVIRGMCPSLSRRLCKEAGTIKRDRQTARQYRYRCPLDHKEGLSIQFSPEWDQSSRGRVLDLERGIFD